MNKPIHIKYRPKNLDGIVGNQKTVNCLKAMLEKPGHIRVFMLHGKPGTGKTTIARIIARMVGCSKYGLMEINAADDRGIETGRQILQTIKTKPLFGQSRVIIIDECFHKDTLIATPDGQKKIKDLKIGDEIFNLNGKSKISYVFKNRVGLDRVVKLKFDNGKTIFCSREHLFLTNLGWKKACELKKEDLIMKCRYRKSTKEICNRSGWETAQMEKEYIERCKKDKFTNATRVESIESYKRGHNEKTFQGVIEDKERVQGFVEFYDLEIEGHPSYFANDILVHNCHRMTRDFQESLLKALEEPPDGVYFIFCTTDPHKIIDTIKGEQRCCQFEIKPVTDDQLLTYLKKVCKKEKIKIDKKALRHIARSSQGVIRKGLVKLGKVQHLEDKSLKAIENIIEEDEMQKETIDLCRALMSGKQWCEIKRILLSMVKDGRQENFEQIRQGVLGYVSAVVLNSTIPNKRAMLIYECFKDPFYTAGKTHLIFACLFSLMSK